MEMDKDQILNDLFDQARVESPQVSFNELKNDFLTQVESVDLPREMTETSNLFTIKTWIIMITSIATTGIVFAFLNSFFNSSTESEKRIKPNKEITIIELTSNKLTQLNVVESNFDLSEIETPKIFEPKYSPQEIVESATKPQTLNTGELKTNEALFVDSSEIKEEYRFPILTEEEKKMYAKQKTKMIKHLIKRDRKMYAYIPPGTYFGREDSISVRPFHMQITEVTNLQYRTFLFDILEQGRRTDFLKAKPDQSQWVKTYPKYNQPMADLYFSHPAYNHYPVNNISREGAELYCVWLTHQANEVLSSKRKPEINDVRLPSAYEWMYAAKGGLKKSPYPWGGPYCRNAKGCYLANFNYESEGDILDDMMFTVYASSYVPNGYGLYCMSGNVAEMVYYGLDRMEPGTKGGSFESKSEYIKIEGKDEFDGITTPNVNIGFRVVVSYGMIGARGK